MAMKKTITIAVACLLAGCANMTPTQKKVAWIVAGVVVTSVVISELDRPSVLNPPPPCTHWSFRSDFGFWLCTTPGYYGAR